MSSWTQVELGKSPVTYPCSQKGKHTVLVLEEVSSMRKGAQTCPRQTEHAPLQMDSFLTLKSDYQETTVSLCPKAGHLKGQRAPQLVEPEELRSLDREQQLTD